MNVSFFIFPDFQLLDLSGPLAAFEIAKRYHGAEAYQLRVVSKDGGQIASSSGVAIHSEKIDSIENDTLFIVGSDAIASVCSCEQSLELLRTAGGKARRVASICTGAYLLAATGLADGRKLTTHWRFATELQRKHPTVNVDPDKIFIRDGNFWSSAGITAGIDLALALIGNDFGDPVSKKVAQDLVVFHRRPGGQSQYSALLEVDSQSERIGRALTYARENLQDDLSIESLAEHACLSPRQFARVFKSETGQTPAKAIEQLRVEAARIRVETFPSESMADIAEITGFRDLERMRRAFIRAFNLSPQSIRRSTTTVA
ncbi:GlxA family transcriptional regulator [Pelagicoccus albus]|uniref:GlxA family transcriptional regulator n=1 Tax=Pelagicoccus albus TaxID=415222 RepID=A0A7X1B4X4_9BACT|nr:GlxA family transcriptional regulator [Pelagicoccus albus]MBC2605597.1 GlxA family transcriptional regulator [Pelagicoccus albus]